MLLLDALENDTESIEQVLHDEFNNLRSRRELIIHQLKVSDDLSIYLSIYRADH